MAGKSEVYSCPSVTSLSTRAVSGFSLGDTFSPDSAEPSPSSDFHRRSSFPWLSARILKARLRLQSYNTSRRQILRSRHVFNESLPGMRPADICPVLSRSFRHTARPEYLNSPGPPRSQNALPLRYNTAPPLSGRSGVSLCVA